MNLADIFESFDKLSPKGEKFKPHKHLALLAVIEGIRTGIFKENVIEYDEKFRKLFTKYFKKYGRADDRNRPLAPYFHLRSFPHWHLKATPNKEKVLSDTHTVGAPKQLHEIVSFAYLSDDFFKLCSDLNTSKHLSDYLIKILENELLSYESLTHQSKILDRNESLHRHEVWAIDKIQERIAQISPTGRIISNYWIYDKASNDYYEADIVLIDVSGIYIIELKHWTGRIEIRPSRWRINGTQYRKDPHLTNAFKCRVLKGICARAVPACADKLWVESVVVLTNSEAECTGTASPQTDKHNPTFDSYDDLFSYFRYRQRRIGAALTHLQIDALYRELIKLQVERPVSGYNFPGYEIVEKLTQRPDLVEILVRSLDSGIRGLQRLRVFNPDLNAPPIERQRFLTQARNTLKTVTKTGDHPNILKVWDRTGDDGIPVEGADWSEQGTLADLISDHADGLDKKRVMALFEGILNGLEIIHDKNIVHRALKPDNILMIGDTPKLMNFDLAYHLEPEEEHITVLPDASKITENPYIAPEIFSTGDCIPASDLFSAGVILYRMLTGGRPFKRSTDLAKSGGKMTHEASQRLYHKGISKDLSEVITELIQLDMNKRPQSVKDVRELLLLTEEPEIEAANRELSPGEHYDVYQIERLIGKGGEAQVYLARRANAGNVAIKLFNQEVPIERIYAEERAMRAVDSPFVVRCQHLGCWENDRHFLVMNFIEGERLRDTLRVDERPSLEQFTRVSQCLLQAVEHLHINEEEIPWLHNDIKPENIILLGEVAVLVDLGTACEPGVGTCMGTAGYIAPDLLDGADLNYCVSGDLFALGITLFEWVAGKRPYEEMIIGETPIDIRKLRPDLPELIAGWLEKAIQLEASHRFEDIKSMRADFDRALKKDAGIPIVKPILPPQLPVTELPEIIFYGNPFVAYLNTLHNLTSNNENALAESQAMNPFFGHIHVPLKITKYILEAVTEHKRKHIILTGHAGDGKSTIGLEVYKKLRNLPLTQPLNENLKDVEHLELSGDRQLILLKDMSELTNEKKIEHLQSACSEGMNQYLIISNTGALIEAFEAYFGGGSKWAEEQSRILKSLSADSPQELVIDKGLFEVINLSMVDNLQTAVDLLKRMIAPERWEECLQKDCQKVCPIYLNAKLIRDNWDTVSERIYFIYRRLFEYGERLTIRQISAHIAYSITSGLDYDGIRKMVRLPNPPPKNEFLFSNRFFGEGAIEKYPETDQLKVVRSLSQLDLGSRPFPTLEHRLWGKDEEDNLPGFPTELNPLFKALRAFGRMHMLPEDVDGVQPRDARRQMRRMAYFFATLNDELSEFISVFLNSTAIPLFVNWQYKGQWSSQREREMIRKGILHVMLEQFTGIRLPENTPLDDIFITLNRGHFEIRQSAQVVLARFNGQDFFIELREGDSRIGAVRYTPVLIKHGTDIELILDLPFLDYVLMRHAGEVGQLLHLSYVDRLERFKNTLLSLPEVGYQKKEGMLLVRLRTNNRFVTQTYSVDHDRGIVEVYS